MDAWTTFQDKGQHVLDLLSCHPWTSLGIATGTALLWSYVRAPRNLPPGPIGLPVVGPPSCYTSQLPQKMLEWKEVYGEIVSFYKFGRCHVILNSEKVIREAFVKYGDDFANRADRAEIGYLGFDDEIFSAPFCEEWKKTKKFAISSLKSLGFGTGRAETKLQDQVQYLEDYLLKTDGKATAIAYQLQLMCSGCISSMILGGNVNWDDPDVPELARVTEAWSEPYLDTYYYYTFLKQIVGTTLTDLLTWRCRQKMDALTGDIVDFISRKILNAAADISKREPECLVDIYLKERGFDPETVERLAKTIMGFLPDAVYAASILAHWCILYVTNYPEVQNRLHREVTSICGSTRFPSLADRTKMPFTQAVIHETLRLAPIFPLSFYRVLLKDFKLGGYCLPKGAVVAANFLGAHYDCEVFPDPTKFKPNRFIDADGNFDTSLGGKLMTFSLGTRKCVAENYFKAVMFYYLARMVQHFEMSFDPDAPAPTLEKDAAAYMPTPDDYKIIFKPR